MTNSEMHKAGNNINFQTEINTAVTQLLMTENEINFQKSHRTQKFLANSPEKTHKGKTSQRESFYYFF